MKVGTSMQRQRSRMQITMYFLLFVCWQAHPSQSSPIYLDNVEDATEYAYPEQLSNPADELRRLRVFAKELLQEMGVRRNAGIKRVSVDQTNAKKAYAQGGILSRMPFGRKCSKPETPVSTENTENHPARSAVEIRLSLLSIPDAGTLQNVTNSTNDTDPNFLMVPRIKRPKGSVTFIDGRFRDQWNKKADFLLSVIGFAVDLANVWRFPYLCYKNGGGAFLIPYTLMLVFGGIPLFYMELALGQYIRKGAITSWGRICPLLKGVGYSVVLVAFYTDWFYNMIIAWSLYYFGASFTTQLPWIDCGHYWNTERCVDTHLSANLSNSSEIQPRMSGNSTFPVEEFFHLKVLGRTNDTNLGNLGRVQWPVILCFVAVMVICYFSLWKGIHTSGKVVWFTAIFPYVVLFILLFRGLSLDGALDGIRYYIVPDINKLRSAEPWVDAATQVFFSLGPGFGVLMAYASYNDFHNNVYRDALVVATINSLTSMLSGFVVFSMLGYMANKRSVLVSDVIQDDPVLVFSVYPEALATLPGSVFWSIVFFLMLLTLGLDSSFGGSEAVITALSDEYPILAHHRELFVLFLFSFYCIIGTLESTQFNIVYGLSNYQPLQMGDYKYPIWATVVGWILSGTPMLAIPVVAIYQLCKTSGTMSERFRKLIQPCPSLLQIEEETTDIKGAIPIIRKSASENVCIAYEVNHFPPARSRSDPNVEFSDGENN
ncbi:Sodium-dependent dopamine transporter [Clonorchis sinensis]|uniref:Transporter n=1 Tax=Clonorchis sinensis TaxID=79923 RepID=A0A419PGM9_CLOSI|nr:Sodium-dependent dopamine transporter [Clonorchis sinensis]